MKDKNNWKTFKQEKPKEETYLLIQRTYSDEEFLEWESVKDYDRIDFMTGIVEDNTLHAGDRNGTVSVSIFDEYLQNDFWKWKYLE